MAKKSSIEKNKRRERMAKQYAGRRNRLKAIADDEELPIGKPPIVHCEKNAIDLCDVLKHSNAESNRV